MDDKYLRRHREELSASSAVVTPICIVIDISHSMNDGKLVDRNNKKRIERLKDGIEDFLKEIREDDFLSDSVEIAAVAFNTEAYLIQPFTTIENLKNIQK